MECYNCQESKTCPHDSRACGSADVVKNISSDPQFKDITFIAPTKDVSYAKKCNNVIVHDTKEVNGHTVLDTSPGKGPGKWNTYRNGSAPFINSQYPGNRNLKPGTANFKYNHTFL